MRTYPIIAFYMLLAGAQQSAAQDYQYPTEEIEKVYIVANTTIVLKAHAHPYLLIPSPENKRAKKNDSGLKPAFKKDNTGFNVWVENTRRTLNIESYQPRFADPLILYLPASLKVSVENRYHTDVRISGFSNEIEVKANHGDVIIENVNGPLILDCGHGNTYVTFTEVNQSSPMSIINSHGMIDITLPQETSANLELDVPRGELYSEFELAGMKTNKKGFQKGRASDQLTSELNGGGVPIMIFSSWGDVYLRKQ